MMVRMFSATVPGLEIVSNCKNGRIGSAFLLTQEALHSRCYNIGHPSSIEITIIVGVVEKINMQKEIRLWHFLLKRVSDGKTLMKIIRI